MKVTETRVAAMIMRRLSNQPTSQINSSEEESNVKRKNCGTLFLMCTYGLVAVCIIAVYSRGIQLVDLLQHLLCEQIF